MMAGMHGPDVISEATLLVDIGSALTKGVLVGRVRGRWRIVAAVTQPTAWGDERMRVQLAARLQRGADRRLAERLERIVADAPVIECHTPPRAGRLVLAAVSSEVSAPAARQAAESAGWVVVEEATIDDGRTLGERLAALQEAEVDAWLLAGGFDDTRAEQAMEMAALVAAARGAGRGPVTWAGSARLREAVEGLFEPGAVTAVANPRPSPEAVEPAPLRSHLEALLQRTVEPGSTLHLAPVAFRRALGELGRSSGLRLLGVDIGARYATLTRADPNGEAESRVFAAGGLTGPSLTESGSATRLSRSLPYAIDELVVADVLQNVRARPATVPQTEDELAIVQGAARQQLAQLAALDPPMLAPVDLIVGSGRTIAGAPSPAQALQILLDGLRPIGITQLAIDAAGALAPLGALDDGEIGEGIGVLRDDLLVPLGAVVVTRGSRPGQPAMRARLHRPGWPEGDPAEVRSGSVVVLPLPRGSHAELEIELSDGVTLGGDEPTRRVQARVTGGVIGLVLDGRDVPLLLPRRRDDRRAVLAGWREALTREAMREPRPAGGEARPESATGAERRAS